MASSYTQRNCTRRRPEFNAFQHDAEEFPQRSWYVADNAVRATLNDSSEVGSDTDAGAAELRAAALTPRILYIIWGDLPPGDLMELEVSAAAR